MEEMSDKVKMSISHNWSVYSSENELRNGVLLDFPSSIGLTDVP